MSSSGSASVNVTIEKISENGLKEIINSYQKKDLQKFAFNVIRENPKLLEVLVDAHN